mmetsp:Transcript_13001/g.35933  ORF Transcript_13001/g.35933 Transcript_13001/m.35933 type:complete len:241 (-) Transcript_13001:1072-1794(-)
MSRSLRITYGREVIWLSSTAEAGLSNSCLVSAGSFVLKLEVRALKTHTTFTVYPPSTPQRKFGRTSRSCSTTAGFPFEINALALASSSSHLLSWNTLLRTFSTPGSLGTTPTVARPKSDGHHTSPTNSGSVGDPTMSRLEMIVLTLRRTSASTAQLSTAPPSAHREYPLHGDERSAALQVGITSPPRSRAFLGFAMLTYGAPLLVPAAKDKGHHHTGCTWMSESSSMDVMPRGTDTPRLP